LSTRCGRGKGEGEEEEVVGEDDVEVVVEKGGEVVGNG